MLAVSCIGGKEALNGNVTPLYGMPTVATACSTRLHTTYSSALGGGNFKFRINSLSFLLLEVNEDRRRRTDVSTRAFTERYE